ncbi:TrmH family RNA methyltransferase [Candidatus Saccharibacteria bacterium]|nr:TrmH family RNA methyltransferase [Candidatus Saccharibacteria bacterium]
MRQIILIIHNVRSAHNVGSLLRTADGLGIERVVISGHSPYPKLEADSRLPHLAVKNHRQIQKTALGAETSVAWEHVAEIDNYLDRLKSQGYQVAALEQTPRAILLNEYSPPNKTALLVGSEIGGIEQDLLSQANVHLQIPMLGAKESFNVSVAAAMALYHLRYS